MERKEKRWGSLWVSVSSGGVTGILNRTSVGSHDPGPWPGCLGVPSQCILLPGALEVLQRLPWEGLTLGQRAPWLHGLKAGVQSQDFPAGGAPPHVPTSLGLTGLEGPRQQLPHWPLKSIEAN